MVKIWRRGLAIGIIGGIGLGLLLLLLPIVCAGGYYADINIGVDDSGFVTIDGITNYPELLIDNTELYTSKNQSYWLLNVTKEENFSDFVYSLTLPSGSSINYIKSSGSIRIEEDYGKLIVKGFGQDESFSIVVQYQVEKATGNIDVAYIAILLIIIIVVLSVVFLVVNKAVKKRAEGKKDSEIEEEKTGYDFSGLSDRQKEIMKLLIEKKRPLTQTAIQKELNIPKAAVSRNIGSLELKGLVEKENIGMSNLIRLKKS